MTVTMSPEQRLAGMREVGGALSRVFVDPDHKILWISLNKNACTSLKWMMADLLGEDLDGFVPGLLPVTGPADAVQNRKAWKHAPKLDQIDPAIVADISPANGWFVFAVVRDPRNRLFSAWQNKLLLENPGYTHYRDKPWYPQHPMTAETIVADFEKFVTLLEDEPDHRIRHVDPHFRDQAELLMPHVVDYSRIYEIGELKQLVTDLTAHLEAQGWTGTLHLPKSNDTPLRVTAAPFADGVRERVEKLFAADFAMFPDRWDFAKAESAAPWTDAEIATAELHAMYGRRLGDLRNLAIEYRDRAADERKRADLNARKVRQLTATAPSVPSGGPAAAPSPVRARLRRQARAGKAIARRLVARARR